MSSEGSSSRRRKQPLVDLININETVDNIISSSSSSPQESSPHCRRKQPQAKLNKYHTKLDGAKCLNKITRFINCRKDGRKRPHTDNWRTLNNFKRWTSDQSTFHESLIVPLFDVALECLSAQYYRQSHVVFKTFLKHRSFTVRQQQDVLQTLIESIAKNPHKGKIYLRDVELILNVVEQRRRTGSWQSAIDASTFDDIDSVLLRNLVQDGMKIYLCSSCRCGNMTDSIETLVQKTNSTHYKLLIGVLAEYVLFWLLRRITDCSCENAKSIRQQTLRYLFEGALQGNKFPAATLFVRTQNDLRASTWLMYKQCFPHGNMLHHTNRIEFLRTWNAQCEDATLICPISEYYDDVDDTLLYRQSQKCDQSKKLVNSLQIICMDNLVLFHPRCTPSTVETLCLVLKLPPFRRLFANRYIKLLPIQITNTFYNMCYEAMYKKNLRTQNLRL